jgi:hypothetical protein
VTRCTTQATLAAFGISVYGSGRDRLCDDGNVATISALAPVTAASARRSVTAQTSIASCVAVIGWEATVSSRPSGPAISSGTAVSSGPARGVDVHADDEVIDLNRDIASVTPVLSVGTLGAPQAVSTDAPISWRIVTIPMIDSVISQLSRLSGLTCGTSLSCHSWLTSCDNIRHLFSPFVPVLWVLRLRAREDRWVYRCAWNAAFKRIDVKGHTAFAYDSAVPVNAYVMRINRLSIRGDDERPAIRHIDVVELHEMDDRLCDVKKSVECGGPVREVGRLRRANVCARYLISGASSAKARGRVF